MIESIILVSACIVEVLICMYALKRNEWVCEKRKEILDKDIHLYYTLPSYNEMLGGHGFWVWDVNYFLGKAKSDQ